jgi:hypothetical protein
MRTAPLPLLLLMLLTSSPGTARAADCRTDCTDAACVLAGARCLLDAGQDQRAKDLLKQASAAQPGNLELRLLLARAYWALGNTVWARRVLYQLAAAHPRDCQVRAWQIWLHLKLAELEQARDLLQDETCPGGAANETRWALLQATLARYQKDPEGAAEATREAHASETIFEEDRPLLRDLTGFALPDRPVPLQLRLEAGAGYTSNGLASSPAEPGGGGSTGFTGSPALLLDGLLRFEPPWGKDWLRPLLELSFRSLMLLRWEEVPGFKTGTPPSTPGGGPGSRTSTPWDFSYFNFGARPGIVLGPTRLLYSGQMFLLAGPDEYAGGPRIYYETHRGEIEWDPTKWLNVFGGAGRSIFRERVRTRTELDLGLAAFGPLWRLRMLAALTGRRHWAEDQDYNLWGGTFIASGTLPTRYVSVRARLLLSFDLFPDSGDSDRFGGEIGDYRRDLLLKGALELWSPGWHGLRGGLTYEVAHRFSNKADFEYTDHRILARVRYNLKLDPWAPSTAPRPAGHVALPYGISGDDALEDERIQDLLRQEDAARRGSSCVN